MAHSSILHLRLTPSAMEQQQDPESGTLAALCRSTTPAWDWAPQGVFLDMTGTDRLYGRGIDGAAHIGRLAWESGDLLAAGTAPTRLAAKLASLTAARAGGGVLAIFQDQIAAFLQPFPVRFLPGKRSVINRLHHLGVRSLGDLQRVPRSLLLSVFGEDGCRLADEAHGRSVGMGDSGSRSRPGMARGLELVAGVQLVRPVNSVAVSSALRRGLAVRALTLYPGGPSSGGRWSLIAVWPEGLRDSVSAHGPDDRGWKSWLGFLELLWKRLPVRRKGLLSLELRAGHSAVVRPPQGSLFPGDENDVRLAQAMRRSRLEAGSGLGPACEDLPAARCATWYGPGEVISKPGQGLVDDEELAQ